MKMDMAIADGAVVFAGDRVCAAPPMGLPGDVSVRTPTGYRRVEFLRRGDLVITRDHGLQPIRMIWRRTMTAAEMSADPSLAPVRVKPRAIGPMMPQRDVLIGGGHRLLVPDYRVFGAAPGAWSLIEAREIAGSSDAVFIDRSADGVTLHTFLFDCHQLFQANGLWIESFLPSAGAVAALDEERREDIVRLFPELKRTPSAYPPALYPTIGAIDYRPEFV